MKKKDGIYSSGIEQEESSHVNDPVMAYQAGNEITDILPRDTLSDIAEYTVSEHRAGRCIPHSQLVNSIMTEKGWI